MLPPARAVGDGVRKGVPQNEFASFGGSRVVPRRPAPSRSPVASTIGGGGPLAVEGASVTESFVSRRGQGSPATIHGAPRQFMRPKGAIHDGSAVNSFVLLRSPVLPHWRPAPHHLALCANIIERPALTSFDRLRSTSLLLSNTSLRFAHNFALGEFFRFC